MRLQRFLALAGLGSRRGCEELLRAGSVKVNGKRALLGQKVNPSGDRVTVNGKEIRLPDPSHVYLVLHKPEGYLCTASDPFGRPTIFDLVRVKGRVYSVGRLDKDSEGLILLTNDGDLAYKLTHPRFQVEKIYEVEVSGVPARETLEKLRRGIFLEDGMTLPCQATLMKISGGKKSAWLEIKIREGKKREIRRMLKSVGHPVRFLRRKAMGPLTLGNLPKGRWRALTSDEVELLKQL